MEVIMEELNSKEVVIMPYNIKVLFMGPTILVVILLTYTLYKKYNYITKRGYLYLNVIYLFSSIVGYWVYKEKPYIVIIISSIVGPSIDFLVDLVFQRFTGKFNNN
jgi:hypothetical protein